MSNKDINKFKQVFLYVLNKVGSKPNVGQTVLHKLMYFIDFDYFEKHGKSITGIIYKKNHHGPTFDPSLIKSLEDDLSIIPIDKNYRGLKQKKYLPTIEPDLSVLSGEETKHIDDVLSRHSNKTAMQIEDYSHGDIPWMVTKKNQSIEYESVFYRDENYSVRDTSLDDPV